MKYKYKSHSILTPDEWAQIEAFWLFFKCQGKSGGVIKAPYTTNQNWLRYVKELLKDRISARSVESVLRAAYDALQYRSIHYLLMQPCIIDREHNKREKCRFFKGGKTTGFSVGHMFIDFVQRAYDYDILIERHGHYHCWLDQLARVDVMYNEFEKRMAVNEIESLQACYEMKGSSDLYLDLRVESFLLIRTIISSKSRNVRL